MIGAGSPCRGKAVDGAAGLFEEMASSKISGEEDRCSHTDLWDFQANIDGAQKIVALVEPLVSKEDPGLIKTRTCPSCGARSD